MFAADVYHMQVDRYSTCGNIGARTEILMTQRGLLPALKRQLFQNRQIFRCLEYTAQV